MLTVESPDADATNVLIGGDSPLLGDKHTPVTQVTAAVCEANS